MYATSSALTGYLYICSKHCFYYHLYHFISFVLLPLHFICRAASLDILVYANYINSPYHVLYLFTYTYVLFYAIFYVQAVAAAKYAERRFESWVICTALIYQIYQQVKEKKPKVCLNMLMKFFLLPTSHMYLMCYGLAQVIFQKP